jgi:ribosomal protein S18 acetylase RimI-like enzyme
MDVHPARPATHDDVDDVAALAAGRRNDYELQQPRFWRQAEDALTRHTSYLHGLIDEPEHIFLVTGDGERVRGFVIGRLVPAPPVYDPAGLTCLVDDLAVESADAWEPVGLRLLRDVSRAAAARGAVQVVVVSGRHDEPKRRALQAAGLVPATEWWIGSVDSAAGRAPGPAPTPHARSSRDPTG